MVPFADQINLSSSPNVNWKELVDEQGRMGFFMRANRDIKQGEQIFTSYGYAPNWQVLHSYGLVDPSNPVLPRRFLLNVELDATEKLAEIKKSMLGASSVAILTDTVPST